MHACRYCLQEERQTSRMNHRGTLTAEPAGVGTAASANHADSSRQQQQRGKARFYAVAVGRTIGIFTTASESNQQTHGVPGARCQRFASKRAAQAFLEARLCPQNTVLAANGGVPEPTVPVAKGGTSRGSRRSRRRSRNGSSRRLGLASFPGSDRTNAAVVKETTATSRRTKTRATKTTTTTTTTITTTCTTNTTTTTNRAAIATPTRSTRQRRPKRARSVPKRSLLPANGNDDDDICSSSSDAPPIESGKDDADEPADEPAAEPAAEPAGKLAVATRPTKRQRHGPALIPDDTAVHAETAETRSSPLVCTLAPPPAPARQHLRLEIHVVFDGGSRGNPGVGGAGAAITMVGTWENDKAAAFCPRSYHVRHFLGDAVTSNEAEYHGILMGLAAAKREAQRLRSSVSSINTDLIVRGDSMLVVEHIRGSYRCKCQKLLPLYRQANALLNALQDLGESKLSLEHHYRLNNAKADDLANQAMDSRRSWYTISDDRHELQRDARILVPLIF